MLTIGRLADAAGVSVRTVRYYHEIGILPEPVRDASGYRRYPARTVVELIRIRTLADAGVPLARVPDLLDAPAEVFATAIKDIDESIRGRIGDLEEHRRRIQLLDAGDALVLDPRIVASLRRLRELGVGERALEIERDAWVLMSTLDPERLPQRIHEKLTAFDDPATMRLYIAVTRAIDWEPDDPRLRSLADDIEAWEIAFERDGGQIGDTTSLMPDLVAESPGLRRLLADLAHRAKTRKHRPADWSTTKRA